MSSVRLIPTGLDELIAKSDTLSAWGYRADLYKPPADKPKKRELDSVTAIHEFLRELARK